jgi:hypothetical protein
MLRCLRFSVLLLFLGFALGQTGGKQWERIGLQKVNSSSEEDSFSVGKEDRFKAIRIRAVGGAVVIEKWILEYRDGTSLHVGFFGLVSADRDMPPVPVRPGLKKVRFRYQAAEASRQTKLELQGRQ